MRLGLPPAERPAKAGKICTGANIGEAKQGKVEEGTLEA